MNNKNIAFKQWLYNHHRTFYAKVFESPINVTPDVSWKILRESLPLEVVYCDEYNQYEEHTHNHRDQWIANAMSQDFMTDDDSVEFYETHCFVEDFWETLCGVLPEGVQQLLEERGFE